MSNYLFSDFFAVIKTQKKLPPKPISFSFQESSLQFTTDDLTSLKLGWDKHSKEYYLYRKTKNAEKEFLCYDFEIPSHEAYTLKHEGREVCYWNGKTIVYHSSENCTCDD
jgi:hypothetical protein